MVLAANALNVILRHRLRLRQQNLYLESQTVQGLKEKKEIRVSREKKEIRAIKEIQAL
jgi:hypothetical protein